MDWCSMDPGLTCMHAYVTGDILRGNAGRCPNHPWAARRVNYG